MIESRIFDGIAPDRLALEVAVVDPLAEVVDRNQVAFDEYSARTANLQPYLVPHVGDHRGVVPASPTGDPSNHPVRRRAQRSEIVLPMQASHSVHRKMHMPSIRQSGTWQSGDAKSSDLAKSRAYYPPNSQRSVLRNC